MPAERFYLDAPLANGSRVELQGPELHHLAHVMRVRIGQEVELVNGKGALATARLLSTTKQTATLEVLTTSLTPVSPNRLILAIPLLRPAKLEWIIEKGTELGTDSFWLYPADHSEKDDLSPHQLERLHYLAISAMKQCGRLDLPSIQLFEKMEHLFSIPATYLFGDTREKPSLSPHQQVPLVFISGPEKGFSPKELSLLDQKANGIRLNPHILRAETAPITAAAILSWQLIIKK